MTKHEDIETPDHGIELQSESRPGLEVELLATSGGNVKILAKIRLRSSPRRGESVEFLDDAGSPKVFRIMEVVHSESRLRLYGQLINLAL